MARCNADNYLNIYSLQNLGHVRLLHSLHTKKNYHVHRHSASNMKISLKFTKNMKYSTAVHLNAENSTSSCIHIKQNRLLLNVRYITVHVKIVLQKCNNYCKLR